MFSVIGILGRVKAETVNADAQPVHRHIQHCLADPLVIKVQFRHMIGEVGLHQQIRLLNAHEMPAGRDLGIRFQPGIEVIPDIVGAVHQMGVPEIFIPAAVRAGMVQRQVQDQLHVPFMAQGGQFLQVFLRPEGRVDLVVICHIIFMIGRRKEDRRQPDTLDAEAFPGLRITVVQVIHPVDDPPQITDTVSVGIGIGTHKDLVKHTAVILHFQPLFFRGGNTADQCQDQRKQEKTFHAYSLLSTVFFCIMYHPAILVK